MKKNKINLEGDFLDFIDLCNKHQVKYLVIGGYAVSIHGYPRSTKDLDICIELSSSNANKMISVIQDFGMASLQLKVEDFLVPHFFTQLGYAPIRIDIMNDIDGVDFEEAWNNKKIVSINNINFNFIGYNDLLKVKEKSGRPQDLADIHKLKQRNNNK
jgi:hypothetical protein